MSSSLSTQTLSSWIEALSKCLLICSSLDICIGEIIFSFLDFITDNVMLDFKCTLVGNTGFLWRLHVALINRVYHYWKIGTYPCGTSSIIMRSDLLSNHLDVIGNLHHASTVHWRFFHQVIFFYLHTRVSFWYASKSWYFSSYVLYSISLENILCIHLM